jgi:hypothetical protein
MLFVKVPTTTNIESFLLDIIGNPTMKFIEITSCLIMVLHMDAIIMLDVDT